MRSAELCGQFEPIPVFLKRGANKWEYAGNHVMVRWTTDPEEVRTQEERLGRSKLTWVIFMAEAKVKGGRA